MKVNLVKVISFSPTGGSKKIAEAIAQGMQAPIEQIDLTPYTARKHKPIDFGDELVIFSVPVYAGRVPNEAAYRIRMLARNTNPNEGKRAIRTPAVTVVTYGNRAYDDALRELSDIVSEIGFNPIAAGAFICEHSFSVPEVPTAHGRPDEMDLEKAEEFGRKIKEKYEGTNSVEDLSTVVSPGTYPYSLCMRGNFTLYDAGAVMTPFTDEEVCSKCGKCVEVCPTASIEIKNVVSYPAPMLGYSVDIVSTKDESCLWCCACVKNCPTGARKMSPRMIVSQVSLSKNYPERKEAETYL